MALYVCFNDDLKDPTYTSLEGAFIVDGPGDCDDNPCAYMEHLTFAPVCPINMQEARAFAMLMGWELIVENSKVSFRTGISAV